MADIDWDRLREAAVAALSHSYSPYSNYPVGVAGYADDGRLVWGANIENASYGITLCAECGLVSDLVRTSPPGERESILAFACVGPNPGPLLPCGRCRQLLHEHGGAAILIDRAGGPTTRGELIPDAFGPDSLP